MAIGCDLTIILTVTVFFGVLDIYFLRMWRIYSVYSLYDKYLNEQKQEV